MRMDYYDFIGIVASGKQEVGAAQNQVMPAFGTNPNVMCYSTTSGPTCAPAARTRSRAAGRRSARTRPTPSPRPRRPAWRADARDPDRGGGGGCRGRRPAAAQVADLVDRSAFRVCADPANTPLSAEDGSGFENQIAELMAASLGVPVEYTWFPQVIGFVRQTLGAGKCDVVMGYAQGDELVLNTNHYYTSTHVLVTRADGELADVDTPLRPAAAGKADRGGASARRRRRTWRGSG